MQKVSVRDFRNNMSQYMSLNDPLAVTKHDHIIGYYIPTKVKKNDEDILALREAASKFDALLAEKEIDEDEIIREFKTLHKSKHEKPSFS